mgnify:CR=1 FL=1
MIDASYVTSSWSTPEQKMLGRAGLNFDGWHAFDRGRLDASEEGFEVFPVKVKSHQEQFLLNFHPMMRQLHFINQKNIKMPIRYLKIMQSGNSR